MDFSLINSLMLLGIALLNAITAYIAWNTGHIALQTRLLAEKTEINTNSMKDALIAATAKASMQEGRESMRAESEHAAVVLVKAQSVDKPL